MASTKREMARRWRWTPTSPSCVPSRSTRSPPTCAALAASSAHGRPGLSVLNFRTPMAEALFEELKRYVRFSDGDSSALRAFAPHAAPRFRAIADQFYQRLSEHPLARSVFSGPEQVERLKGTL